MDGQRFDPTKAEVGRLHVRVARRRLGTLRDLLDCLLANRCGQLPEHGSDARRRFGHLEDIETGGRPEFGVCATVDMRYVGTGGARAAVVLAAEAVFVRVLAERTAMLPRVPPYWPGQFYLCELPPLRAVLAHLRGPGILVVDGYADLDPGGRPGLGARPPGRYRERWPEISTAHT